jgi:hypothetical protein
VMRCKRAGRGNGARIAKADALRPMSAFGVKRTWLFAARISAYVPKTSSGDDFGFGKLKYPVPEPEFPRASPRLGRMISPNG